MCFFNKPKPIGGETPTPQQSAAALQGAPTNPANSLDSNQLARRSGRSSLRIDLGGLPGTTGLNIPT